MKVLLVAMAVFAVSGASAGLLGIGGALIFNPYLLQLGMDPRVRPSAKPLPPHPPPPFHMHIPYPTLLLMEAVWQQLTWPCGTMAQILKLYIRDPES